MYIINIYLRIYITLTHACTPTHLYYTHMHLHRWVIRRRGTRVERVLSAPAEELGQNVY